MKPSLHKRNPVCRSRRATIESVPLQTSRSPLPFDRTHLVPGTRVAVALSGGADSTALLRTLHAANQLPRDSLGIGLAAIHIHHGIRGEAADRDRQFAKQLCAQLAIPLTLKTVDTPAHAAAARETLEEAARNLRYAAFNDLLTSGQADAVATAHTADDQAETVLMKLLRGAWTEGLAGIYPVLEVKTGSGEIKAGSGEVKTRGGRILRPLLGVDRAAIEQYLRELEQPWVEDETNADPFYTRNRLRHTLLPALREENPSLNQTLAHLAEIARDEESYWQAEISRLLPQLVLPGKPVRGGGRANSTAPDAAVLAIELERLRPLAPAIRRRVLRATARRLGVQLSFAETARLLAFAGLATAIPTVPTKPGSILTLANGLQAERSLRELRLSRGVSAL